jgi:tetratricopeptide (TPR) repeat protein
LTTHYPGDANTHWYTGLILHRLDRNEEAVVAFEKALQIKPDHRNALAGLGAACAALQDFERALTCHRGCLELDPESVDAQYNCGLALRDLRQPDAALDAFERVLARAPEHAEACRELGMLLLKKRSAKARQYLAKALALALSPESAKVHVNLGTAYASEGAHEQAIAFFDKALMLSQEHPVPAGTQAAAHWNKSISLLALGRFSEGWPLYEYRWQTEGKKHLRKFDVPQRTGREDLHDKTLLLHAEQGFGDTIQFARLIPQLAARGATVLFQPQAALETLYTNHSGIFRTVNKGEALEDVDFHCPLLSLPAALQLTTDTIPPPVRLTSDPARLTKWQARLGPHTAPRIGIVWAGNPEHSNDDNRSLTLAPLLDALPQGLDCHSLQKYVPVSDRPALTASLLRNHAGELGDFGETAALCTLMDVIVTVDTAVAHLAGTLGKTVWILLPFAADWRWFIDRQDSPWYPPARLYRQSHAGDWTQPLQALRRDLELLLAQDKQAKETKAAPARQITGQLPMPEPSPLKAGLRHFRAGKYAAAFDCFTAAINRQPESAEAHFHLANTLQHMSRWVESIQHFDLAISRDPASAQAFNNRGHSYRRAGNVQAAINDFRQALLLQPDLAAAQRNLGLAFLDAESPVKAAACLGTLCKRHPDNAEYQVLLGRALLAARRSKLALSAYDTAVRLAPDYAPARSGRAAALQALGRVTEALAAYDEIIVDDPANAAAHNNRGLLLEQLGNWNGALEAYQCSTQRRPDSIEGWCNLGNVLKKLHRLDEALAAYGHAIALKPDYASAHWNKSLTLLLSGDYRQGWPLYEWRWKSEALKRSYRQMTPSLWTGPESLENKSILLHAEQGLGDTLQFCRYAPLVAERGARVVLEVHPPLQSLLSGLPGITQVIPRGNPLPETDFHCPLMSLPRAFDSRVDTLPPPPPLLPDKARQVQWSTLLGARKAARVGLVWSGQRRHSDDRLRSLTLAQLLARLPTGPDYISLQKELREQDLPALREHGVREFSGDLSDFSDTAALCREMDLVISVDTSVAHMAGTLGKTVWILLPFSPDWRWLLDRRDSPWYPSAKLYRQPVPGDWDTVLGLVSRDLQTSLSAG